MENTWPRTAAKASRTANVPGAIPTGPSQRGGTLREIALRDVDHERHRGRAAAQGRNTFVAP